jgi:hypothetical protein
MPTTAEQKTAFVERPFRAQVTNAPYGCGFGASRRELPFRALCGSRAGSSSTERARAAISSATAEPSERARAAAGSIAAPRRARAAISSATAAPSGLELPFRAPLLSRASGLERQHAPLRLRGGLEPPFRAPLRHRAVSSCHFERHCGAERAGSSGSGELGSRTHPNHLETNKSLGVTNIYRLSQIA